MITKNLETIASMLNVSVLDNKFIDVMVSGICIDSRKVKQGNLFIPIVGANQNGHKYVNNAIENKAVATLWNKDEPNPPTNIGVILVDDTLVAMQQLATTYRSQLKTSIIGVAGSNGKTSTKDILAGMLSTKFKTQKTMGNHNNELGVPITLLNLYDDCEVAVVEMGMEKKGELLFLKDMVKPDHAILTNVGLAHLENFDSLEELAEAKAEIADCINDNGLFIYNGDDKLINNALENKQLNKTLKIKTFGFNDKNNIYYKNIKQSETGITFETDGEVKDSFGINMLGKHQALNAIAAMLAAKEYKLTTTQIKDGLNNIEKTGLRNELLKVNKCTILNDTYKSNPNSVLAALDTFEEIKSPVKVVVLGDMLGLGKKEEELHYEIGSKLSNYTVDELVTYGELGKFIANGAKNIVKNIKSFDDKNLMTNYLSKYLNIDSSMVIKASRSLELDEVVDKLKSL
ncbi:UDP-N-acetylmuramoyl-tripeptide--D-alanyl-D-alanine ligase [Sedimentibacter sp. zth1]|uniref:UDP-N-acetylmuramoyl-tripeptide--D-alanyl-D- alanine ligase n=1 Tax=Sedimentibacter sp. zth1 TaxID=2816908 RepID=UPI001A92D63D|nr:UDP-N-acetylmuramoyl-tripeptide--D-alanyl-D-alanine ligase [Sedimentibacter sp. zth1]QSX05153.1 UDP-N-acetylmuramoyl-tripeptide--D-alanyl-D-alanine ligase [Sedimentibacter sp. zth1]